MRLPRRLEALRGGLRGLAGRLDAISPLAVLRRGYSLTFRERDGALVRSSSDVAIGEVLQVRLAPRGAADLSDCEALGVQVTSIQTRGRPSGS
jgi:exodeoxyribonuclease VII large subunit